MKLFPYLIAGLLLCPLAIRSQTNGVQAIPLEKESHHSLAFENDKVRLFRLQLQPDEVTKTHRHSSFYAYFPLGQVTISNEVKGRAPVISRLEKGELRISKGGFNVAERNKSSAPADIFVVQPLKSEGAGFEAPLVIRMHDAGIIEQYSGPTMRVYSVAIASGGRLEERAEKYDLLMIAVEETHIRESVQKKGSVEWNMKPGEFRWIPRGTTHSETNMGSSPAAVMVLEFN